MGVQDRYRLSSNRTRTSRAQHVLKASRLMEISMSTNQGQGSARIYQFPAGGRSALGGRRYEETKANTETASSRVSEADCSGSWYHEAAIQESKPAWER